MPEPASKMSRRPPAFTSRHSVSPPYLAVAGPGLGMDPRVLHRNAPRGEGYDIARDKYTEAWPRRRFPFWFTSLVRAVIVK